MSPTGEPWGALPTRVNSATAVLEEFVAEAKALPDVVFERLDTFVARWIASAGV